jgi:hypothetical protein
MIDRQKWYREVYLKSDHWQGFTNYLSKIIKLGGTEC